MSDDAPASAAQRGAFPLFGRVYSALLLVFCCGHAVFLIASIVPRNPPPAERGNPAVALYRMLTGGQQQWNVFETIPFLHSLDARIEVDDGVGGRAVVGSVLPGFTPYPRPERSRYYILFHRMLHNTDRPLFFEAYLRTTEALLRAQRGSVIDGHWTLVVDVEWTRTLLYSRRDGVLSVPASRSFDAANIGGIPREPNR